MEDTVADLKSYFEMDDSLDARFFKKVPQDLLSLVLPGSTCIVFDDMLPAFMGDKSLIDLLFRLSSIYVRHRKLYIFFCSQSSDILKKSHKLNLSISQSSHYILFRTLSESKTLKRFFSNFSLNLKHDLAEIFENYIMTKQFGYLVLSVGPQCPRNSAYSNILLSEPGFMLSFDKSDDEED